MSNDIKPLATWATNPAAMELKAIQEQQKNVAAKAPLTTEDILKERGSRYGSFKDNSRMSQGLSAVLDQECHYRAVRGQEALELHQLEAIEMIFHKIARIVSGDDPTYADNWDDIAGYAQLGKVPR